MSIFITNEEHHGYITECLNLQPKQIVISTFGLYAGLLWDGRDTREWGQKYYSATREQLELMRKVKNVQILVGITDYYSCKLDKSQCIDCEVKFVRGLFRLAAHIDAFPEFQWRISNMLHLKCAMFFYDDKSQKGVAGGRNFTDSGWADVTFEMTKPQITTVTKTFIDLWRQSKVMHTDTISNLIEEYGISDEAMDTLTRQSLPIVEEV